jgi:hypothetical protein
VLPETACDGCHFAPCRDSSLEDKRSRPTSSARAIGEPFHHTPACTRGSDERHGVAGLEILPLERELEVAAQARRRPSRSWGFWCGVKHPVRANRALPLTALPEGRTARTARTANRVSPVPFPPASVWPSDPPLALAPLPTPPSLSDSEASSLVLPQLTVKSVIERASSHSNFMNPCPILYGGTPHILPHSKQLSFLVAVNRQNKVVRVGAL